jgi:hypothetical protein
MMFAEDYLEFNETEAQAEADSGLPQLCKCDELSQDCDCESTLKIPTSFTSDEAQYWLNRAEKLSGHKITPEFIK